MTTPSTTEQIRTIAETLWEGGSSEESLMTTYATKRIDLAVKQLEALLRQESDITVSCYSGHTVIKRGPKKHWVTLEHGESINLAALQHPTTEVKGKS